MLMQLGAQAVKLKEKGAIKEIVVVSCGGKANQEVLRTALAMGADRAIHVNIENDSRNYCCHDHALTRASGTLQPLAVAKLLAKISDKEKPDIVLLGKQVREVSVHNVLTPHRRSTTTLA